MKRLNEKPAETISQRDRAYNFIRAKLLNGGLLPGERLSNRVLANEIGISFIPVREAISQLVSEGLVAHEPKLGCFVKELNRQEILELYDLREALEGHAVSKAVESISEEQLQDLHDCNDKLREILGILKTNDVSHCLTELVDQWKATDAKFHFTLLHAAGNRLSLKTVTDLRVMAQVFGLSIIHASLDTRERTYQEHQQITDALMARNGELARQTLVQHIRAGREHAFKQFDHRWLQGAISSYSKITS